MLRRSIAIASLACLLLTSHSVLAVEIELRNDGFETGMQAGFQGGFVSGEIGAVRLEPPGAGPYQVKAVTLLFGGNTSSSDITLHIWVDNGGDAPGAELFQADYTLTGADDAFSVIDLSLDNVYVTGPFRVGIEFTNMGYPSIARDNDGTITANLNFIYADLGFWAQSSLFGLTGDWIIRATIDDNVVEPFDAGPDAAGPTPDAARPDAAGPTPDAGNGCMVHSECPTGQYCDDSDTCTYDCRVDYDCGDGMRCTSLGMCEAVPDDGCGCEAGGTEAPAGPWTAGLFFLGALLLVRRRRRRN